MEIRRATLADLPALAPLFDRYRQFYGQPSDSQRARRFLAERLEHGESVVFMAFEARQALGFVQLYPGFSSVGAAKTFVLNDLYVEADGRRGGTGRALVEIATTHAREAGAASLSLQTGVTNDAAQQLYESLGWTPETRFLAYGLSLAPTATA
jgi:ribosomal protein S18 acetylase RimI-like enzyme